MKAGAPTAATPLVAPAHHEPKVTNIELLTDLVFVVALKVTADKLEEDLTFHPGLSIFLLRVFFLWVVWHMGAIIFNMSQR